MSKYHISENGEPRLCEAKIKCRLGGESGKENHYDTPDEARKAYEEKNTSKNFSSKVSVDKDIKINNKLMSKGSYAFGVNVSGLSNSFYELDSDEFEGLKGKDLAEKISNNFNETFKDDSFKMKSSVVSKEINGEKFYGVRSDIIDEGERIGIAYSIISENDSFDDILENDINTESNHLTYPVGIVTDAEGFKNFKGKYKD